MIIFALIGERIRLLTLILNHVKWDAWVLSHMRVQHFPQGEMIHTFMWFDPK